MELRRFFVDSSNRLGDVIEIYGDEFSHIKNVLRMKVGFKIIVCFNDGTEHYCTIEKIDKDRAEVRIEKTVECAVSKHKITLFCAVLKNNKLDLVIQKAVELGVYEIVPFVSQNTNETKFNADRANKIALEAAKQCGSATLTTVEYLTDFDGVLSRLKGFDSVLMPYEDENEKTFKSADFRGENHAIIIGSEGGFAADEVKKAKDRGAQIVTLGKRILRADTASIVSAALMLNELGELKR